jgi:hypothetical protein
LDVSNQFRDIGVSIRLPAQEDKQFAAGLKMHHGAHVLRSEVRNYKSRKAEKIEFPSTRFVRKLPEKLVCENRQEKIIPAITLVN